MYLMRSWSTKVRVGFRRSSSKRFLFFSCHSASCGVIGQFFQVLNSGTCVATDWFLVVIVLRSHFGLIDVPNRSSCHPEYVCFETQRRMGNDPKNSLLILRRILLQDFQAFRTDLNEAPLWAI